jgi:hypothetical protein
LRPACFNVVTSYISRCWKSMMSGSMKAANAAMAAAPPRTASSAPSPFPGAATFLGSALIRRFWLPRPVRKSCMNCRNRRPARPVHDISQNLSTLLDQQELPPTAR